MSSEITFDGWLLENFSVRHELLELHLIWYPPASADVKDALYRGRAVFTRPSKVEFSKANMRTRILSTTISVGGEGALTHRLELEGGGVVEVDAIAYHAIRW